MKRTFFGSLILALAMLLAGCQWVWEPPPTAEITEPPKADIGGTLLDYGVETLDLHAMAYRLEPLLDAAQHLTEVVEISMDATGLTPEQLSQIQKAYPNAEIDYSLELFGQILTKESTHLDASAMTADQTDVLIAVLPLLPKLEEINFVSEEGVCVYSLEQLQQLEQVQEALPEAHLRVRFDLFGQTVTSEDERIEYLQAEIGNEGVETIRAVLPHLRSCTYFLMDGCGIDNEVMDQLRSDFPDVKIVWRVWLVEPDYRSKVLLRTGSYLTDTHRVRTIMVNDWNCDVLKYCTETKYLDVGHVMNLRTCEFLAYMPDLEACIIAITRITDISPLANHEKLEYLEIFTTNIEDLSPLASCPNLEHLNISFMPYLDDISPLYGLTKLKRLRIVNTPGVTKAQKEEFARRVPGCDLMMEVENPTLGGWRKIDGKEVERYALLREQMEYDKDLEEYGIY